MADDLVQFLRARLDEDERAARDAGGKPWAWEQHYGDMCNDPTCEYGELATDDTVLMDVHGYDVKAPWQGADHIARHDPARVLAEVDAKRRIVGASAADCPPGCQTEHSFSGSCMLRPMGPAWENGERWVRDEDGSPVRAPHTPLSVLRFLALPYADHPDYREEWRP